MNDDGNNLRQTNNQNEIETIQPDNLGGQNLSSNGRKFGKISKRKNTIATTKAVRQPNNLTEESLANFKED